jgi:hypothetical protein
MTGFKKYFSNLTKKSSSLQVELGDDSRDAVKGIGEASIQLDSGNPLSIKYIVFIQGLKKDLLSISTLEDKGLKYISWMAKLFYGPKIQA